MRKDIKRYDLNESITLDKLKENNFRKGGFIKDTSPVKYFYDRYLVDGILLHIEIGINKDGTFNFDDYNNIYVLNDKLRKPYYPFYSDNQYSEILDLIIIKYNQIMDDLTKKDILQEKVINNNKILQNKRG